MTALIDSQGAYFLKRASEILDFSIDWSDVLELGETISTSTWTVPNGITRDSDGISGQLTIAWIKSGTAGLEYVLGNTIVTSGSRTLNRDLRIKVIPTAEHSDNLISLAYLKTIMGKSDSDPEADEENGLLLSLISAASSEIKRICRREFFSGTYIEKINPRGAYSAWLKESPVDLIYGIHEDLQDAIILTNAAVNAVSAHAWVKGGHLFLRVNGGISNGIIDIDMALVTADTLGELVTTINAAGSGWHAVLSPGRTGYESSSDLIEFSPVKIESPGTSLQMLGELSDFAYDIDYESGMFTIGSIYPCQWESPSQIEFPDQYFWVKYKAGYTEIPEDLKLITARWAIRLYHESKADPSIIQEKIGDYFSIRANSSSAIQTALENSLSRWKGAALI